MPVATRTPHAFALCANCPLSAARVVWPSEVWCFVTNAGLGVWALRYSGEVIKDRIGCRSELIREKLADAEPDEPNAAMVPQDKHGALSSPWRKLSTGSVKRNFHLTIAPSTGRKVTPHRGGAQIQTRVSPSFDRAFI